jgi:cytochrome c-type biogenesis protein CcmH
MSARKTRFGVLGALLLGFSLSAMAVDVEPLPTPEMQQRFDDLTHEFRCMQCQNQSIADSAVGLAADLRRDVREQVIGGKTDEQIRESMVARYGNVILFRPPFEKSTAWVWVLPVLLLLVGVYVAFRVVKQRAGMVAGDDSVVDQDEIKS